jgi:hypothetical protein
VGFGPGLHNAAEEGPGTSRSEIRRHGDDQDKAGLEAADAELKARRSRKGIRHRRHPRRLTRTSLARRPTAVLTFR